MVYQLSRLRNFTPLCSMASSPIRPYPACSRHRPGWSVAARDRRCHGRCPAADEGACGEPPAGQHLEERPPWNRPGTATTSQPVRARSCSFIRSNFGTPSGPMRSATRPSVHFQRLLLAFEQHAPDGVLLGGIAFPSWSTMQSSTVCAVKTPCPAIAFTPERQWNLNRLQTPAAPVSASPHNERLGCAVPAERQT